MCNVSEKINELNLDELISISGEDNEVFPYLWSLAEEKNCIYADGSIDTGALSIRITRDEMTTLAELGREYYPNTDGDMIGKPAFGHLEPVA